MANGVNVKACPSLLTGRPRLLYPLSRLDRMKTCGHWMRVFTTSVCTPTPAAFLFGLCLLWYRTDYGQFLEAFRSGAPPPRHRTQVFMAVVAPKNCVLFLLNALRTEGYTCIGPAIRDEAIVYEEIAYEQ